MSKDMVAKEAVARIKISKLQEESGWCFLQREMGPGHEAACVGIGGIDAGAIRCHAASGVSLFGLRFRMIFKVWLTFAAAYLITTLSPGPNVLLVIRNSLKYGTPSALVTIFGNLASQLMIVILVGCGVGATLAALPQFFLGMKIVGAGYLIFLGFKQINVARKSAPVRHDNAVPVYATMSKAGVFREAFLVSSSNPKTLIFLSAFMPQFVDQSHALAGQFALMYLTIAAIVVCVHVIYSVSANTLKRQIRHSRFMKAINYLGGSIFVLVGLKLLTNKRVVSV